MASETKISLKLIVDKKSEKVLFAEAGKDFVDFLFGLLEIPLGSIMGFLVEQGMAGSGSWVRVYESVHNLDPNYLQPNQNKDSLLRPPAETASSSYSSHPPPLLNNSVPKKQECLGGSLTFSGSGVATPCREVGYVKGMVTYMVMDDLTVTPISSMTLLNTFDVKDVGNLQEKTVVVDTEKALELLKASFASNTVLTDMFIGKKREESSRVIMSSKKVTLKSSDGQAFEVDEAIALKSQMIKHEIESNCIDSGIPLPNVTSKILAKVIEYCKKHIEAPHDEDLKVWDAEFVMVDTDTLFDLIQAAEYLNIKSLLDLTCQTVADMIKGKTPEEIRKTFYKKKNYFTPEEEENILRENQWAFE